MRLGGARFRVERIVTSALSPERRINCLSSGFGRDNRRFALEEES